MHHTKTILLASLLLFPLSSLAQTEVPNAFSDGTPALAAEVNENFTAVADGVNAQDVRIQNVESAIAGPEKMVFLGYAAGAPVYNNLYTNTQICKEAYGNSAAQMLTSEAWMKFINEGTMALPSSGEYAAVRISDVIMLPSSGFYVPSLNMFVQSSVNFCGISPSGETFCSSSNTWTHIACMAPAG